MTIEEYCEDHENWSRAVFGAPMEHDAEKLLKHIGLELNEVRKAPHDLEEWVDIIILAIDGAWRSGHSAGEIERTLIRKQECWSILASELFVNDAIGRIPLDTIGVRPSAEL